MLERSNLLFGCFASAAFFLLIFFLSVLFVLYIAVPPPPSYLLFLFIHSSLLLSLSLSFSLSQAFLFPLSIPPRPSPSPRPIFISARPSFLISCSSDAPVTPAEQGSRARVHRDAADPLVQRPLSGSGSPSVLGAGSCCISKHVPPSAMFATRESV